MIIVIDANVGAGKSTLVRKVADILSKVTGEDWYSLEEPADTDVEFKKLLGEFVKEPTDVQLSIRFQKYISDMNYDIMKDAISKHKNIVAERSMWTGSIFMEAGSLPEYIKDAINLYMDVQLGDYPEIDYAMYLKRDYMACFDSCNSRGRKEESGYIVDDFKNIEKAHEDHWMKTYSPHAKILRVFGTGVNFADAPNVVAQILTDIKRHEA